MGVVKQVLLLPVRVPLTAVRIGASIATEVVRAIAGPPGVDAPPPPAPPRAEPQRGRARGGGSDVSLRPEPDIEAELHPEVDELFDEEPSAADMAEHRRELHEAEYGGEGGAEMRVNEPWEGYDRMPATEIVTRLTEADAAKIAIVRLYEASHKQRQTVLRAADDMVAGRADGNGA